MIDDEIYTALQSFLSGSRRIAIIGIGNDLRSDDGIGPFIVNTLRKKKSNIFVENVGSVLEAFTSKLVEFGADRIILIDAADMKKPPGHVELVTSERVGGIAISTHRFPLSFLMMYLEQITGAKTVLLGVQPSSLEFGGDLTPKIEKIARKIISTLNNILNEHIRGSRNVPNNRMVGQ